MEVDYVFVFFFSSPSRKASFVNREKAEIFFILLTTPMTVTHHAEFTIISLLNIIENALQLLLHHIILVRLSAPKNTQPIVSTAQTCMLNYKNCPISYYLGYRFNFMEYETSLKITVQQDKETNIHLFFCLFFPLY